MTRLEAKEAIHNHGDKIFTVVFIKKNGEQRVMNCRKGVKKGVKGVGLPFDPADYNLMPVFDMQKNAFRMINFDTITSLSMEGEKWEVN